MPLDRFDRSSVDDELIIREDRRGGKTVNDLLEDPDNENIKLPTYLTSGRLGASTFSPTAVLDCVDFVKKSLQRTRLTVFEITRRQSSIFSRSGLGLKGAALELDKLLAQTENALKENARFEGVSGGDWLTKALVAHSVFKKANATAKTKLLKFDRTLRIDVADPLKRALIDKKKPDYEKLRKSAKDYVDTVVNICKKWDKEILPVGKQIQAQGPPDAALLEILENEDDEIEVLIKQATQKNLQVLRDPKFCAIGGRMDTSWPHHRPDGERKAIHDFLREYCRSHNLPALPPDSKKNGENSDDGEGED